MDNIKKFIEQLFEKLEKTNNKMHRSQTQLRMLYPLGGLIDPLGTEIYYTNEELMKEYNTRCKKKEEKSLEYRYKHITSFVVLSAIKDLVTLCSTILMLIANKEKIIIEKYNAKEEEVFKQREVEQCTNKLKGLNKVLTKNIKTLKGMERIINVNVNTKLIYGENEGTKALEKLLQASFGDKNIFKYIDEIILIISKMRELTEKIISVEKAHKNNELNNLKEIKEELRNLKEKLIKVGENILNIVKKELNIKNEVRI